MPLKKSPHVGGSSPLPSDRLEHGGVLGRGSPRRGGDDLQHRVIDEAHLEPWGPQVIPHLLFVAPLYKDNALLDRRDQPDRLHPGNLPG